MTQDHTEKTVADTDPKKNACVNPFPDVGGLYLLIAGIVLGVLLGPALLGRVAPSVYQDVFVGGGEFTQQIAEEQAKTDKQLEALTDIGVTEAAIPEQALAGGQHLILLQARRDQAQRDRLSELTGWTSALMLAVIAVMMIESLVSPDVSAGKAMRVPPALGRLVTARYALAALWITVVLAQPALLKQLPILFVGSLVVVALAAALVPLGKKES
jgi:hypothetical protein